MMSKEVAKAIQEHLCSICDSKSYANEVLEDIKAEINGIDSMTFIGNGSGCASDMRSECLKIIDKHISGKDNNDNN